MLLFAVGFFVWFALKQAHENDERVMQGKPLDEVAWKDKVFVWPNLVYTELICMVVATIVLVVWSIYIPAPLEQPANPSSSPNPSKAPWYFLGLQEMLVYFDPWIAGVLLPGFIILGLMATPYIDKNPKGNGYYTFKERKFAITIYLFGFSIMWVLLIINGTFLRGPNWNFFGPYEPWDIHKLVPLNNVNLSEFIYVKFLGTGLPKHWFFREIFGIALVVGYFAVGHWYLAKKLLKRFHDLMGPVRFHLMAFLLLVMVATIAKMYLRWTMNLKYIIGISEFFFNI
ncbi:MAG: cytochrome C [Candidatus Latescibacteria bacterium]|nr:cytochrome C [Candidatus Latescibacterota bacterium]